MCGYQNAIEISGLTKRYDGFTLDNVSFSVPVGSIMGFIGQNGARKIHDNKGDFEYHRG